jgi:ASCH domain
MDTTAMRALTVWQPWTDAIARGTKRVENRSWPAPPGIIGSEIAIHAGQEVDKSAVPPRGLAWPCPGLPLRRRVRGAVIAVAVVTGCHHASECRLRPCSPWAAAGQYHWEMAQVRPLPAPVPARGSRRLWPLPPQAAQAVRLQLAA